MASAGDTQYSWNWINKGNDWFLGNLVQKFSMVLITESSQAPVGACTLKEDWFIFTFTALPSDWHLILKTFHFARHTCAQHKYCEFPKHWKNIYLFPHWLMIFFKPSMFSRSHKSSLQNGIMQVYKHLKEHGELWFMDLKEVRYIEESLQEELDMLRFINYTIRGCKRKTFSTESFKILEFNCLLNRPLKPMINLIYNAT